MNKRMRRLLRDGRIRKFWKRFISVTSCIVVFCTTYALLLPAITMEKTASCGIEAHEHSDSCYEERLICGQEETEGHRHNDDCYQVDKILICVKEEHSHTEQCYDQNGNLTCALDEHSHMDECLRENRILVCPLQETEGHTHTAACYEKVLVCRKDIHVHNSECYKQEDISARFEQEKGTSADEQDKDSDFSAQGTTSSAEKTEPDSADKKKESYSSGSVQETSPTGENNPVQETAPVDPAQIMTAGTSVWYREAGSGEYDWKRIADETVLHETDVIRLYYAYTIPAGTLDSAGSVIGLPLPDAIQLTDEQIREFNAFCNGRGAEAAEGTRTPDTEPEGAEWLSACVHLVSVEYEGMLSPVIEMEIAFEAQTIEKNRGTYDENGNPVTAGQDVSGFFSIDFYTDCIRFAEKSRETVTETVETEEGTADRNKEVICSEAKIILVPEDSFLGIREIGTILSMETENILEEKLRPAEGSEEKDSETESESEDRQEPTAENENQNGQDSISENENQDSREVGAAETCIAGTLDFEGPDYSVTASFDETAEVPEGARLEADEILPGDSREEAETSGEENSEAELPYDEYVSQTEDILGLEEGSASYIRLFDIKIVDKNGDKVTIAAPVDVKIELADKEISRNTQVVHFPGEDTQPEVIEDVAIDSEKKEEGLSINFEAEGFSVYAVVDAPEPVQTEIITVSDLSELQDGTGFYLSYGNPKNYFTSDLNGNSAFIETTDHTQAAVWYFEPAGNGSDGRFFIYTKDGETKKYIKNTSGNLVGLAETGPASFTLSRAADGKFYFKLSNANKWLQHSGSGNGIRFYTDNKNPTNSQIIITYTSSYVVENDPYGLDGKSYGIAFHDEAATAAALTAQNSASSQRLDGVDMLMKPNVQSNNGILLVAENSDIQMWTFESVEADRYHLTTMVDGQKKYLTINGSSVTLQDEPDEVNSLIHAEPGTGTNAGKWHFTVGRYSLNLPNTAANGFNAATGSGERTWMNLVEKSSLSDEDFVPYTARKISASDEALKGEMVTETDDEGNETLVHKKAQVVLYTRLWNDNDKRYEFYAVDYSGNLIRVYESGDVIQWVGNKDNSALWEFTEYTDDNTITGTPTDYYELESVAFPGDYLAPQSGDIVFDHTVGIHLNGRTEGYDYTTVTAWDQTEYAFVGMKVDRETMKVVTCPLEEAEDFYFATIVPAVEEAEPLSTVNTVNNNAFGISMKMIDFNNGIVSGRDSKQAAFLGEVSGQVRSGLLSPNLGSDGYPVTTSLTPSPYTSFGELFDDMTPVNHLFIQSTYKESGYFEYDSTQNFAHLNEDGNFTVYDQLGAITGSNERRNTRTHGQFMPYDEISKEKGYAVGSDGKVITNDTDVLGNPLPDSNPRTGEKLYALGNDKSVDYFFGMELDAGFTQTADGLDDWGHDIIFEFSGDDDFWFYVDGVLVLDLGDIHSAQQGSVNFCTGEVTSSRGNTTLYEIFRQYYNGPGSFEDLFQEKEVDGEIVHVFKDYTKHSMKMLYMERGAGASNLHMRFNLASVEPAAAELTKKLSGAGSASNKLIKYPYQIWYRTNDQVYEEDGTTPARDDQGNLITTLSEPKMMVQGDKTDPVKVVYKGTNTLVPYKSSMSIDGREYQNVFLLRAGQTAVINFPENIADYKIIECGVDTEVYSRVAVNWEEGTDVLSGRLYNNTDGETGGGSGEGTDSGEGNGSSGDGNDAASGRLDFGIPYKTTEERPRVEYDNRIDPEAMRTMSFKKIVYDTTGENVLSADQISDTFTFRLYLGDEYSDADNLSLANMYAYYVKDPDGNYCRWNSAVQQFEPMGQISTFSDFEALPAEQKRTATFHTSINGSISRIPAGYTVEVRELIAGTKWKLEERDWEIPKGYTRREADGYVRTDLDNTEYIYTNDPTEGYRREALDPQSPKVAQPVSETIKKSEDAHVEVRNQEGWGLTAEKVWTDKDFMTHDDIYFAVFLKNADGSLGKMINNTVRRLKNGETEVYYFFADLRDQDDNTKTHLFSEYVVREVTLQAAAEEEITVDETTGEVTGYDPESVDPVECTPGDDTLTVGGTPAGGNHQDGYIYTVSYEEGDSTGENAKIRTDTVTNSRPGIEIYKMQWDGSTPLAGAKFTLKDAGGHNVAATEYTSDADGKITIAYLSSGEYTLTETIAPKGYVAPDGPLKILVAQNGEESTVSIEPENNTDSSLYTVTTDTADGMTEGMTARITVKNRSSSLQVRKVDAESNEPVEEVHFALYRRTGDGNKPLQPMEGYSDIVTGADGVLAGVNLDNLRAGTYYLTELEAAGDYIKLADDLIFTIANDGSVSVVSEGHEDWLSIRPGSAGTTGSGSGAQGSGSGSSSSGSGTAGGQVNYVLTIPNSRGVNLGLKKEVTINGFDPEHSTVSDKNEADGEYVFDIVGKEGTLTEGKSYTAVITVTGGAAVSATLRDNTAEPATDIPLALTDGVPVIPNLIPGNYIITERLDSKTGCISLSSTDSSEPADVENRQIEVTLDAASAEMKTVTVINNYADNSETDIAHISVRKTFEGLKPGQKLPQDFHIAMKVTADIEGEQTVFNYDLKGEEDLSHGVVWIPSVNEDGDVVWDWKISIRGMDPDAQIEVEELNYTKPGYDDTHSANPDSGSGTSYSGTVQASTTVANVEVTNIITAQNKLTFPMSDLGETATVFVARLVPSQTAMVISYRKLNLSERAALEEQLKHMPIANNWYNNQTPLYYSFEESQPNNEIVVRNMSTVTYDPVENKITFSKHCQWNMAGTVTINYQEGRPADFNFVNSYAEHGAGIDIVKVDNDNRTTTIPGAAFTLTKLDERTRPGHIIYKTLPAAGGGGNTEPAEPGEGESAEEPSERYEKQERSDLTGNDGKTGFAHLTSGYYEIRETQIPPGYILTGDGCFYVLVEDGAVHYLKVSENEDVDITHWEKIEESEADDPVQFTAGTVDDPTTTNINETVNAMFSVGNISGAALPYTGGPGTGIFRIAGVLLILAATALLRTFRIRLY